MKVMYCEKLKFDKLPARLKSLPKSLKLIEVIKLSSCATLWNILRKKQGLKMRAKLN